MLAQACMQSEYYDKVVDAVKFYSRTAREVRPFETLVNLMYQRPISPQFQVNDGLDRAKFIIYQPIP